MTRGPISAALVAAVLLQALAGCAQQAPKATIASEAPKQPVAPPPPPPAAQEPPPAPKPPSAAQAPPPRNLEGFVDEPALKDVLFERDRADILRKERASW